MGATPRNYGRKWSREELVLALDLYCRIPFSTCTTKNPLVVSLAQTLERSPASIARKLGNLGANDPTLQERGISGLTHQSKLDAAIWDEFYGNWEALALEAHSLRQETASATPDIGHDDAPSLPSGETERVVTAKQRICQGFFRSSVLSSYDHRCCMTGIAVPEALIASHIVPWSKSVKHRADPTNGLCLSATFDRLFDRGLITIRATYTVQFSPRLRSVTDEATRARLLAIDGRPIRLPSRFPPSQSRLAWHRKHVFDRESGVHNRVPKL